MSLDEAAAAKAAEEAAFLAGAGTVLGTPAADATPTEQPGGPATPAAASSETPAATPTAPATTADDKGAAPPTPAASDDLKSLKEELEKLQKGVEDRFGSLSYADQKFVTEQLEAAQQKVYGKIGEMTRTLNEVKERRGSKIDPAKLKTFTNEWGEDFARAAAEDLTQALMPEGGPSQEDIQKLIKEEAEKIADERVSAAVGKATGEELDIRVGRMVLKAVLGRDWENEFKSNEFTEYMKTQPADRIKLYAETTDALDYVEFHKGFKSWQAEAADRAKKAEEERKKLEAAVPAGTGATTTTPAAVSEDEAFVAAFNATRGR